MEDQLDQETEPGHNFYIQDHKPLKKRKIHHDDKMEQDIDMTYRPWCDREMQKNNLQFHVPYQQEEEPEYSRRYLKRRRSGSEERSEKSSKRKLVESVASQYKKSCYKSNWTRGILKIKILCKVDWGWKVQIMEDSVSQPQEYHEGCKYWVKWSGFIDSANDYLPIVFPIHLC